MITAKEAARKTIVVKNRMSEEMADEMLKQITKKIEKSAADGADKIEYDTEGFASDREIKLILKKLRKLGYKSFAYKSFKQSKFSNGKFKSHTISVKWVSESKLGFPMNILEIFTFRRMF